MKLLFTSALFLGISTGIWAQLPTELIPNKAIMVMQINPGPVAADPALQESIQTQLYNNKNSFESLTRFTGTRWWLESEQRDSLDQYLNRVSINASVEGINPTQPMFIYRDTRDTVSIIAYVFTLQNPSLFLNRAQQRLFPKTDVISSIKRNGYEYLQNERITVAVKNNIGWIIVADYNFRTKIERYNDQYANAESINYYDGDDYENAEVRALVDSLRSADSAMAAEAAISEYENQREYFRQDSIERAMEAEFSNLLNDQNFKTYDSIVNVVVRDREKKRKKGIQLETTFDEDISEVIEQMRNNFYEKKNSTLKPKETQINRSEPPQEMLIDEIAEPMPEVVEEVPIPIDDEFSEIKYTYQSNWRREQRERDSLVNRNVLFYLDEITQLKPAESIHQENHFAALDKNNYDAVYYFSYSRLIETEWVNRYNDYSSYMSYSRRNERPQIDSLFRSSMWYGAGFTGTARLDGNHLEMNQQFFFNPEVTKLSKGLFKGKVDKGLLNYVKSNPYSVLTISANTEKLMRFGGRAYREYVGLLYSSMSPQYGAIYSNILSLYRVFLDDDVIYNLFTGDAVFAVTDLVPKVRKYQGYDYDQNFNPIEKEMQDVRIVPEFVLAASVGRKKKMQEIIDIGVRAGILIKVNNYYVMREVPRELSVIYVAFHKGKLIITNDSVLITENLNRGYAKNKSLTRSERRDLRSSPVSGWWDAERTRLTLQQRGEYSESGSSRRNKYSKITNRMKFRGRRGPGGTNQIEFSAEFTDENLPEYGYIRTLRIFRLMYHLDRSF